MKRLFIVCLALVLAFNPVNPVEAQVADRILVVVNGDIITLGEFNASFEPLRLRIEGSKEGMQNRALLEQARSDFLERMISELLIEQEARKSGIAVREEEVMGAIRDMVRKRNSSLAELAADLAKEGTSFEDYKKGIKGQLTRMKLLRREVKAKVIVTPGEIGEYYRRHLDLYEGQEAVRLKQILIPVPRGADASFIEQSRKLAEEIRERLSAGEAFEKVFPLYARRGNITGGDLGYLERGVMHGEVEEVAFSLGLNELSQVIESPAGFHILSVIDRRGAGTKTLEEMREEIRVRIEEEKMEKRFEEWLGGLRRKSYVEIRK